LKNCPVESKLFPAERRNDRRTERHDEANSRFLHFAKAPKKFMYSAARNVRLWDSCWWG